MLWGWWLASAWAGAGWTIAPLEPSTGVRFGAHQRVQLDVLVGPTLSLSDTQFGSGVDGDPARVEGLGGGRAR